MRGYNERYCSWTNTAIQCDYFNKVRQVKKDGKSDRLSNNINSNIIYRVLEKCITLYVRGVNAHLFYQNILKRIYSI